MTIKVKIEGFGELNLTKLVLDLNGTISENGKLFPNIEETLSKLKKFLEIFLISADSYGNASYICDKLKINLLRLNKEKFIPLNERIQKGEFVKSLGAEQVVAIGNGRVDIEMFKNVRLAFGIIGREGASPEALQYCDLVFKNPIDALEILLNLNSLKAGLRS